MQRFGLDFGTTNSSLTWARAAGDVVLCDLDLPAINPRVLRSLIYFSLEARDFVVGQRAIDEYLAEDMQGTLIQSIKTFLADNSFEQTWINDRYYKLEDLIAVIFRHVRAVIARLTSEEVSLVVGRPAIFAERPQKEALAQERLRKAAQLAGFFELRFQYEPIAAGLTYESSLTKPEVALIADLGGGTSDFTVMRLGSGAGGDRRDDILATRGVQIAGDAFSACIMARKLAKYFGAGSTYRSMEGRALPFPSMLLAQLSRWHQVTFLRSPKTREQLDRIRWTSSSRRAVDAFQTLITGNYAFFLFQEIEQAKRVLSERDDAVIRFRREAIEIDEPITRAEFEQLIAADQRQVRRCMESVLAAAQVTAGHIDAVFLTGGTAQIPAIRRMFAEQFGEAKLKSQDYLTSVAVGLGLSALHAN